MSADVERDILTEAFHYALDGSKIDAETSIDVMTGAEREALRCACEALLGSLRALVPVTHYLNAYTWAGRRAACAVTAEFLDCNLTWEGVTCPKCLATRAPSQAEALAASLSHADVTEQSAPSEPGQS